MILTEKEIKNVPKKMIISTYFKDNEENGNFSVAFSNSYYYTTNCVLFSIIKSYFSYIKNYQNFNSF